MLARVLILCCVAALLFTSISSHVGPSCLFGLPAPKKCPRLVWKSSSLGTIRPAPPSLWHQECGPQADSWSSQKSEVETCGTRARVGLNTKQPDDNLLRLAQLCINFSSTKWQLRGLSGVRGPRTVCHRGCSFVLEPTRSDVTENNVPMTGAR